MTTSAAALVPLVDALLAEPLENLSQEQLQERVVAITPLVGRLQGWVQQVAGQLDALVAGTLPDHSGGKGRSVAGWCADVQRVTVSAAGRQLRTSAALRALPDVVEALLDGTLTPEQAAVLARLVGKIDASALEESQPDLIAVAAGMDPVRLASWVAHLIATHCEPALGAAAARGRDRRFLQTSREADGSVRGRFVLAGEDSEALLSVLEPLARRQGLADDRSAGQRRADALVEVCEQVLRFGELPHAGGQRPQLSDVLPAGWAAAQQTQASCAQCGPRCPAHQPPAFPDTVAASVPSTPGRTCAARLGVRGQAGDAAAGGSAAQGRPDQADPSDESGRRTLSAEHACAVGAWSGPQTRARIETLLCEARITRVLLDGLGQVTGLESLTDSITAAQRRALAARDLGCVARGCTRPPAFCDAHHLEHRAHGGVTTLSNLVLLCRRHHVLWHAGKIGLHSLDVPWHPGTAPPAPTGIDELFTARAGP